jgi:hypothetical protein
MENFFVPPKRLTDGYTIADDGRSIICKRCGKTSHNLNDVRDRYCGHCKLFHEDEKAPLTACVLFIFQPGIALADIHNSRLPAEPSYQEIKALMLPLLDGAKYPEHVSVLFKGVWTDMFVDETGVLNSHGPRRRAERARPAAHGHDRRRAARIRARDTAADRRDERERLMRQATWMTSFSSS